MPEFSNTENLKPNTHLENNENESERETEYDKLTELNIHQLFSSHPELAKIGTEKQYHEYVKTIFPDAAEEFKQLIFKHKTGKDISSVGDKEHVEKQGMFFSAGEFAKGSTVMQTLFCKLDIRKPAHAGRSIVYWSKEKIDSYKKAGFDGAYGSYRKEGGLEGRGLDVFKVEYPGKTEQEILQIAQSSLYSPGLADATIEEKYAEVVVFDLDQVYVLGSDTDAEGFKSFIRIAHPQLAQEQV